MLYVWLHVHDFGSNTRFQKDSRSIWLGCMDISEELKAFGGQLLSNLFSEVFFVAYDQGGQCRQTQCRVMHLVPCSSHSSRVVSILLFTALNSTHIESWYDRVSALLSKTMQIIHFTSDLLTIPQLFDDGCTNCINLKHVSRLSCHVCWYCSFNLNWCNRFQFHWKSLDKTK